MANYFSSLLTFAITIAIALYGAYEFVQTGWYKFRENEKIALDVFHPSLFWTRACFALPACALAVLAVVATAGVIGAVHNLPYDESIKRELFAAFVSLGQGSFLGWLLSLSSWTLLVAEVLIGLPVWVLMRAHMARRRLVAIQNRQLAP